MTGPTNPAVGTTTRTSTHTTAGTTSSRATSAAGVHTYFDQLITWTNGQLRGDEVLLSSFGGENSDFVRFSKGAVRQAGSVQQRSLHLDLIEGDQHATGSVQLTEDLAMDQARLTITLDNLRQLRRLTPADPYLRYNTEIASSHVDQPGQTPESDWAIDRIQSAAADRDLVGIYAAGQSFAGFANSLGQRNWYQTDTYNFDWSFYLQADKAVKTTFAGRHWDDAGFTAKVDGASRQLDVLARKPIDLKPDGYRAFLTPAALTELFQLLGWYGAFSLKAHRTRQTPLLRMGTEGADLHPEIALCEDVAGGIAPNFSAQGYTRPDRVSMIDSGTYDDYLISPRSAAEYGVETNGSNNGESPTSLTMAPGSIPDDDVLNRLGTGLHIGNLWYLNFSDKAACRTTGMTRFATFWVEDGEVVAPVNALRFDDTAFNLLGDKLEGLTATAELQLDPSTYGQRSFDSLQLPGALVGDMRFTL